MKKGGILIVSQEKMFRILTGLKRLGVCIGSLTSLILWLFPFTCVGIFDQLRITSVKSFVGYEELANDLIYWTLGNPLFYWSGLDYWMIYLGFLGLVLAMWTITFGLVYGVSICIMWIVNGFSGQQLSNDAKKGVLKPLYLLGVVPLLSSALIFSIAYSFVL